MTPVKQQTGHSCFRSCIASLLDLKWSDVPEFFDGNDNWSTEKQQDWLEKFNLCYIEFPLPKQGQQPVQLCSGVQLILTGPSPRGDYQHAVIGTYDCVLNCIELYFDPHEENNFFGSNHPTLCGVLVPKNYTKYLKALSNAKT